MGIEGSYFEPRIPIVERQKKGPNWKSAVFEMRRPLLQRFNLLLKSRGQPAVSKFAKHNWNNRGQLGEKVSRLRATLTPLTLRTKGRARPII